MKQFLFLKIFFFIILLNSSFALSGNSTSDIVEQAPDSPKTVEEIFWYSNRDILPYDYAYVFSDPAPVFSSPYCDLSCKPPVSSLSGGFIWVSMEPGGPIKAEETLWYKVGKKEYMLAEDLRSYAPSIFKGEEFTKKDANATEQKAGWIIIDTVTSKKPGKIEYIDGQLLEKHTFIKIKESVNIDGWDWHKIDGNKWVEQRRVALITKHTPPEGVGKDEKWIEINLYEQTLMAYEGDRLVYATLVSSGLPGEDFATETGLFRVWIKKKFNKMSGGEKDKDYYFLQDVPYQIYFNKSFAIHGAYWHDNFGVMQSHGCVNISPRDAKWLFDWTSPKAHSNRWTKPDKKNPGTWVWIHE